MSVGHLTMDVASGYSDLVETVFSSTIAAKAWLATIAIAFALVQIATAARRTIITPAAPARSACTLKSTVSAGVRAPVAATVGTRPPARSR